MEDIQNSLFFNQWGVWFCFVGEPNESNEKYYENFVQVYTIRSPVDLAYLWKQCKLCSLDNFLLQNNSKQVTYEVKQKVRRINSLEYFKKGIEPKWQDPKNEKGGRFIFSVNQTQQNKDQIYTNLVFFLLGEDFNHSERINGFRFISPKSLQTYYRVEIWVDFNGTDIEVLKHYQNLLTDLFKNLNYDSKSVKFLNNKMEPIVTREPKQTGK